MSTSPGRSNGSLCILMPSCERTAPVARLSTSLLEAFWPSHPPIHYCGLPPGSGEDRAIPARSHPRDWMGIALEACRWLMEKGYRSCYLMLDDHPPVGACHEEHLNRVLPDLMETLGASYIGLNGWGQGREVQGERLGPEAYRLERLPEDFLWRFSLHPGLWRLDDLSAILDLLTATDDLDQRSAWAFERRSGAPGALRSIEDRLGDAFRIDGEAMASPACRLRHPLRLALARRLAGVGHRLLSLAGGRERTASWDRRMRFLYRYYRGPYPLYWAGLITKGKPHLDMVRFLKLFGDPSIVERFRAVANDLETRRLDS